MNLVNGYISRLQGFCLFRIIYKPRERILSAHGVMLCKILILYRFFYIGFSTQNFAFFAAIFLSFP